MTSITPWVDEVRQGDRDRFLCAQFAPFSARDDLLVLYAFNLELANIVYLVREPMLAEMRLQWWRDVLSGGGTPTGNPLAAAVFGIGAKHKLPMNDILALIDARQKETRSWQPQTLAELEKHGRETAGRLSVLAAKILNVDDPERISVAEKVGTVWALVGYLRSYPFHKSMGRSYMPRDLCDVEQNIPQVMSRVAELAQERIVDIDKALANDPGKNKAVLLQLTLGKRYLARMINGGFGIDRAQVDRAGARDLLMLLKASVFCKF